MEPDENSSIGKAEGAYDRMKRDCGDKILVLKARDAVIARHVPESHSAVHR